MKKLRYRAASALPACCRVQRPRDPLAEDFGMASVFAYLQPLPRIPMCSWQGRSRPSAPMPARVGTVVLRNQLKGEPQQFGIVFHQFSLLPGQSAVPGADFRLPSGRPRDMVATYSETRLLRPRSR